MNVLKFIYRNLDQFRRRFMFVLVASIIAGVSSFLIPVVLALFTRQSVPTTQLPHLIGLIIGLYIVHLIFQWVVRGSGEGLAGQFANHLRQKYFAQIESLPVGRLTQEHSGNLLALVGRIADEMNQIVISLFWDIAPGIVTLALFIAITLSQSLVAGLLNLVLLAVFVVVGYMLSQRMVPLSAELNIRQSHLIEAYVDLMTNMLTVKKLGLKDFAEARLDQQTARTYRQIDRVQRFHANRWFLLHSLFGVAYIGTISVIVWRVSHGFTALSLLILFIGGYASVRGFIERLSENIKDFMEMRAYLNTLHKIIGESRPTTSTPRESWQEITFKDVSFSYPGTTEIIDVPAFDLKLGNHVCILGPSGQGKSTFLSLLAGYYNPNSGERLVDGQPYTHGGKSFGHEVALISQETELFDMSLRDNLTLGADLSDEVLVEQLRKLGLGSWYDQLDEGLETRLGEKGITLSAGQRQRLNILRGILLDRSLYILDEPTAHLDADTEALVVTYLHQALAHKTAVIVTHRPALQQICERTYHMANHRLGSSNEA